MLPAYYRSPPHFWPACVAAGSHHPTLTAHNQCQAFTALYVIPIKHARQGSPKCIRYLLPLSAHSAKIRPTVNGHASAIWGVASSQPSGHYPHRTNDTLSSDPYAHIANDTLSSGPYSHVHKTSEIQYAQVRYATHMTCSRPYPSSLRYAPTNCTPGWSPRAFPSTHRALTGLQAVRYGMSSVPLYPHVHQAIPVLSVHVSILR